MIKYEIKPYAPGQKIFIIRPMRFIILFPMFIHTYYTKS
jgi:hypothetical protein